MTTLCPPGKRALCPLLPIDTLVGSLLIVGQLLVLCLLLNRDNLDPPDLSANQSLIKKTNMPRASK